MLKLPQTKWRYVASLCVTMGPIKEAAEWLLFGRSSGQGLGQFAGEVLISTIFSIPLGLFFWRIGGPGSRPPQGMKVDIDPNAHLEVKASAAPAWMIPVSALIALSGVLMLSESPILALVATPLLLACGLLTSFHNGWIRVNPRAIELVSWYGRYVIRWSEVTALEADAHRDRVVLFSGDRYLPLPNRMFWTGPHRFEAEALIDHHIAARGVPVRITSRVMFRLLPQGLPSVSLSDDSISA